MPEPDHTQADSSIQRSVDTAAFRAWVEVDLDALARNAQRLHARAGRPLIAVIKADAYGLGACEVATQLVDWGFHDGRLHALATATIDEALALRAHCIANGMRDVPVLCCTPLLRSELQAAHRAQVVPALHRAEDIDWWCTNNGGAWHLSIDTGMQRAGVRWDRVDEMRDIIARHAPAAVFTHFHSAGANDGSMQVQDARFASACSTLGFDAMPHVARHVDNSAAIAHRGASPVQYVRPGLALYGGGSSPQLAVEPIASVYARILDLHELTEGDTVSYDATWRAPGPRTVATLGIGHADGYRQAFGNRTRVLLHGVAAPVVGVVTMDMVMVDVTDIPCAVGDVATLLGRSGPLEITPEELAAAGGLSVYELFIALRLRMPRVHTSETPTRATTQE